MTGQFYDETWKINFESKLENIFYQTDFRAQKFAIRTPFSSDNKGKRTRFNRNFSEGLPIELTDRFTPKTPTRQSAYDSRWISPRTFVCNEPIDAKDLRDVLMDPSGELAKRQVESFNRKMDIDVVSAMFAAVDVGPTDGATTSTSFAADGGLTIDMTAGATYEKLLSIMQILIDREIIDQGTAHMYMSLDGSMNTAFLNELELTNSQYTDVKNAQTGLTQGWGPIEFIRYGSGGDVPDPILPVSGGVRTGYCIAPGALKFSVQKELKTDIVELTQTHYDTWSISTQMTYALCRVDARKILKVTTTAS